MPDYFKNFPLVDLPGVGPAKNIILRANITPKESLTDFTMKQHLRADEIAKRYYDSDSMDWMVYYANQIIDPYFDYHLSDEQLERVLIRQYGSIEDAGQKIMFWQNNWYADDQIKTVLEYNSLPSDVKPFYHANVDNNLSIISYRRKRDQIIKETNKTVFLTTDTVFGGAAGELVYLFDGATRVARAEVVSVTSTSVIIKNVIGNDTTVTSIKVRNKDVTADVTEIVNEVASITETEAPYFDPISIYQAAVIANDMKKKMKLVPKSQATLLQSNLRRILEQ